MRNILIIDGSARKKNTYGMLQQVERILSKYDMKVEIINLFSYRIRDCAGCEQCVSKKDCCIKDDMAAIRDKILFCDGLILSSPVYLNAPTSRFKTFADRLNGWIHKPEIAGLPVMFVATTGSTGLKELELFYTSMAAALGLRRGEFIGRAGKKMKEPIRQKDLKTFMTFLTSDKKDYKPSVNEINLYNVSQILAENSSDDAHNYWKDRGLYSEEFYYPCKINPFKKLLTGFIKVMIRK